MKTVLILAVILGGMAMAHERSHLVILGSSTPEGVGASSKATSWVGLYTQYAEKLVPPCRVTNLARGGYEPERLLPSGDPKRNVVRALELKADRILVNLPLGIGARAHRPAESFLGPYRELKRLAEAGGAEIWFTTSMPKDSVDDEARALLKEYRARILSEFAPRVVDFWSPVATEDGRIRPECNADGTHLNDRGHRLLFETARTARLFGEPALFDGAKVLFVGNSLTFSAGGIDVALQKLAASGGMRIEVRRQAVGGMHLKQHATRAETLAAIADASNDLVVMQDYSAGPVQDPDAFREAGRSLVAAVRASGAAPILYMTWTYKEDFRGIRVADRAMTAALDRAYTTLGRELGVTVVPVGLAFQRALDETRIGLYADTHHPNPAGAYLVACTFYAALAERTPVGLAWRGELDATTAATLQRIAWETTTAYRQR